MHAMMQALEGQKKGRVLVKSALPAHTGSHEVQHRHVRLCRLVVGRRDPMDSADNEVVPRDTKRYSWVEGGGGFEQGVVHQSPQKIRCELDGWSKIGTF